MKSDDLDDLGEPDLQVGGLRIWVHGRQFPDARDYWDGNWFVVTATYEAEHSRVSAGGPILHGSEVVHLLEGAERLHETLEGTAELPCMEPNLRLRLEGNGRGRISAEIQITPDHLLESHTYQEQIDQTFLPPLIQACRQLLSSYPIRGKDQREQR